jgi:hypothetical protein
MQRVQFQHKLVVFANLNKFPDMKYGENLLEIKFVLSTSHRDIFSFSDEYLASSAKHSYVFT